MFLTEAEEAAYIDSEDEDTQPSERFVTVLLL